MNTDRLMQLWQVSLPLELAGWANLEWKQMPFHTRLAEWKRHLAELHLDFESFRDHVILDVGCGPTGILHFLDAKVSFGLDPLAEQYEEWNGHWGKRVQLVSGTGEKIPLKNASIDTVFCINCIDHTLDPDAVLCEIGRVLKPGGLLVFHVDLDSPLRKLHKLARKRCGILHPHSLSYEWLLSKLKRNFDIMEIHRDAEVFKPIWRQIKYEAYWDGLIYRFTGWTEFINHVWLKALKSQP
jgi:ubiquinone/menaquinone biosynthesis C-methylase UbiE